MRSTLRLEHLLPASFFDRERDGDVELTEVVSVVAGMVLGQLAWLRDAAKRNFVQFGLLFSLAFAFLILRSLIIAVASRLLVTIVIYDDEVVRALVHSIQVGQLASARRLRMGARLPEERRARAPRLLSLKPMESWRTGANESDAYELSIDPRYVSRLCLFQRAADDGAGTLRAASYGQLLSDACLACFTVGGQRALRTYFFFAPTESGSVELQLLRSTQASLWPILEAARENWYGARESVQIVKRMVVAEYGFDKGEKEPRRALSSFAMPSQPEAQIAMRAILDDYKDFCGRLAWYTQRGVPYRRGYLLTGKPGCGKTHFTKVLAGSAGADLYTIDISSAIGITDDNVSDIFRALPPRSILLLKNIDTAVCKRGAKGDGQKYKETKEAPAAPPVAWSGSASSASSASTLCSAGSKLTATPPAAVSESSSECSLRSPETRKPASVRDIDALLDEEEDDDEEEEEDSEDDDEDEQRVGYSAMLNALDGALANNQGLTIVMTTNKYEKMMADPEYRETLGALFRPGRVDMRAAFDRPDAWQMHHAVRAVFGGDDSEHAAEAVHAACEQLSGRWPMKSRDDAVAISKFSYSKLKGHMMRFAQKDPATAMSEENIGDFKWRLALQQLDESTRRLERGLDALRRMLEFLKNQMRYVSFRGRDDVNSLVEGMDKDLKRVMRVERRLCTRLEQLESIAASVPPSIATILHDSFGLARTMLEGAGPPMRKVAKVVAKERLADAKEREEEAAALAAAEANGGGAEGSGARAEGDGEAEEGEQGEEGGHEDDADDEAVAAALELAGDRGRAT